MQSGKARTKAWLLEYEPAQPRRIDPLMGWTSSSDMLSQVQLDFDTKEEAVAYAEKNGISFDFSSRIDRRPSPRPTPTISASTERYLGPLRLELRESESVLMLIADRPRSSTG